MSVLAGLEAVSVGMMLAERAMMSYATLQAMRAEGVSDEQIMGIIVRLQGIADRHRSLDLRAPVMTGGGVV